MEKLSSSPEIKRVEKPIPKTLETHDPVSTRDLQANIAESAGLPKRPPLHTIDENTRSRVIELLPAVRADIKMFRFSWDYIKAVRPDAFQGLEHRNPWLASHINDLERIVKELDPKNLQADKVVQQIDEYNRLAEKVNVALSSYERDLPHGSMDALVLSPADKAEMKRFLKDFWRELFPESTIAATTRYYT